MSFAGKCLQLDVGNSGAKWRLVENGAILARGVCNPADNVSLETLLNCSRSLDHIWISSVAAAQSELQLSTLLQRQWGVQPWYARSQEASGELRNSYRDPARMGVDRWLAMLAARERDKGRLCVVDAGSALTIDLVSDSGRHQGGYIIPGPALMERALLLDTDRVRFDEEAGYGLSPGVSTAEAVRHGIALAQAGAVALALSRAGNEPVTVMFCGGGGEALMQLLGRGGTWAPDLVFEGLEIMASGR